ncbi:uncharacterized protein FSUBG_12352 [Fusarium subglutinans]|uniref:Uncharacterized protein n=1 Tax=Gibberella subglutinans TaxID=42677 RepID=A0A8H5L6E7_GIBSU|nr:uncharacterized protein FSUBG_12352 [Fusarium subglutinans]KAF5585763.1 hypothetical protein FSUBG_12352 [Fusarium subglutinans]
MDPFNSLPPEIRLKILFSITSKFSLNSIIRASPTMLQQYQIQRIKFPRPLHVQAQNLLLVRDHLQRWQDKTFASPLAKHDDYLFQQLDSLHNMLLHFIQDYCSKATAPYMPREYICLPTFEDPKVLREQAKRMTEEHTLCDLATMVKCVRYTLPWTTIVCRQPPRSVRIPASFKLFEGKTLAEIELVLGFYMDVMKEEESLDIENPIEFCFSTL